MDNKRFMYLLFLLVASVVLSNELCEKGCTCDMSSITCEGTIPKSVPPNVTTVIITRFLSLHSLSVTTRMNFSHESFSTVKVMHINPNETALSMGNQDISNRFPDDAFVGLSDLEVLQYASLNLKRISNYSFRGLENLRCLDLSNNKNLPGSEVAKALSNHTILPKLEVLRLSNIQSFQLGEFDGKAAVMKVRPITALDLSRLTLEVPEERAFSAFPKIATLNISESTISVDPQKPIGDFTTSALTITSLDASSSNLFNVIRSFLNFSSSTDRIVDLLIEFPYKELFMNDLNKKNSDIQVSFNVTNGKICFVITNKPANLGDFYICCNKRRTGHLVKFSFRQNNVRYFSSEVFFFFNRLEYVNLHGNELVFMQRDCLIEFEKLFSCNNNLTELILSRNSLTDLPRNIFNENSKLRILDLSHNRISSVSFSLTNMKALSFLDLSFNQIKTLDQEIIRKLSAFEEMLVNQNLTTSLALAGNEFQCKCRSEKMVRWFLENRLTEKRDDVKCSFEGKEEIFSEHLLSDVAYSCKRALIIGVVTGVSVLLMLIMMIRAVFLYKKIAKMRKMKHKKELIDLYKTDNRPKKYTVFLSYSSLDIDFIMTNVYKQFNKKLQELLNTEEDCVATGDTDFLPGYQLANEIIRCIEESSVVVLFMTKNFCKSPWCKDEAMAAHYDRKPIILMFGEHVDSKFMPKPLQRHLQVYSRVFWKNEEGEWKLKPDWTKLCEAIVSFVKK